MLLVIFQVFVIDMLTFHLNVFLEKHFGIKSIYIYIYIYIFTSIKMRVLLNDF